MIAIYYCQIVYLYTCDADEETCFSYNIAEVQKNGYPDRNAVDRVIMGRFYVPILNGYCKIKLNHIELRPCINEHYEHIFFLSA